MNGTSLGEPIIDEPLKYLNEDKSVEYDVVRKVYTILRDGHYQFGAGPYKAEKFMKVGETTEMIPTPILEPKQTPVPAPIYQRMSASDKLKHFPVNRAWRRKHGL